jgi:5-methyltetrahydropteroyltriglutamate--homocysteine methyltransferase
MKTSEDRILTTHVGSLPRSDRVVELLEARENCEALDLYEFDYEVRQAVLDVVARQVDTGIDIVSDGETSKISYATYVHDRLSGFSEEGPKGTPRPHLDLKPFPALREKMARLTGPQRMKRVTCVGPIAVRDLEPLRNDLANLQSAAETSKPYDVFMNAASPGVITSFLPNTYYPSHEQYLEAVADAMTSEYETIVAAGVTLQIDCPDLAMSRHTGFQDLTDEEFLRRAERHVEALNYALRKVPADMIRVHVCWGNYEGPHTHDVDLARIADIILKLKAKALVLEAANPRHGHDWAVWQDVELPEDKILVPGVIDTSTNYVEHPELVAERILRFAGIVGRDRVIAGTDCGFGTAAGHAKVDPGVAYLKLGALVEGATRASRQLWT